jgi:hypothetical protein
MPLQTFGVVGMRFEPVNSLHLQIHIVEQRCCQFCSSQLENGEKQPTGVFYFSHDTDMQLFFTSLGIAEDKRPLTHSSYGAILKRKWRTSLLTPFASNFVAVFFR